MENDALYHHQSNPVQQSESSFLAGTAPVNSDISWQKVCR